MHQCPSWIESQLKSLFSRRLKSKNLIRSSRTHSPDHRVVLVAAVKADLVALVEMVADKADLVALAVTVADKVALGQRLQPLQKCKPRS
jgi:hypothetical protein